MSERNSRQSFLGDEFEEILKMERVGIIGYSGGGSHIGELLARYGFRKFFICDPDEFEESNIHRLVGSYFEDIKDETPKVDIAERVIRNILPDADIVKAKKKWQECINYKQFLECKIIFAGLDDFANRVQLESFCRSNGIVLIDIGMSVKKSGESYFSMGQVVLSHPEGPCFKCLDFITDKDLELEASRYGAVGIRQQVASINGILANVAVCLGVELLSGWTGSERVTFYKMLDGNILDLMDHPKVGELSLNKCKCSHYSEA